MTNSATVLPLAPPTQITQKERRTSLRSENQGLGFRIVNILKLYLPESTVSAPSVNSFGRPLDKGYAHIRYVTDINSVSTLVEHSILQVLPAV